MVRMYQIFGSGTIFSQQISEYVKIITSIYDADNEIQLKPSEHPTIWRNLDPIAGYLTVSVSNYNPSLEKDYSMIKILSLAVLDEQGFYITEYEIPQNEIWTCTVEFAKTNNWI
jgi:hypothetical protein